MSKPDRFLKPVRFSFEPAMSGLVPVTINNLLFYKEKNLILRYIALFKAG